MPAPARTPSLKRLRWYPVAARSLVLAALFTGCGGDEPEPPPPPPALRVLAVQQVPGERVPVESDRASVSVGCDPTQPLLVEIGPNPAADSDPACARAQARCPQPGTLQNWRLQPPGACGSASNCGFVVVALQGSEGEPSAVASTLTSVLVPLPEIAVPSVFTLVAELRSGDGAPIPTADGGALGHAIELTLSPTEGCPLPADAGADDGGGDAGASDAGAADASNSEG